MKEYYFISGLPRSGSTLLSAILKQNPDFYADIASPVHSLIKNTIECLTASENSLNIDEEKRISILHHIFEGYYSNLSNPIIFDSCRSWTGSTSLLKKLFPNTKIICCVREINWILDSFERIAAKNSLYTNTMIDDLSRHYVGARCESLMNPEKMGTIIRPWLLLQEGYAANKNMIFLIDYKKLCKNPKQIMEEVYNFIGKKYYEHDFNNVEYQNEIYDRSINMKDLHTVRKKVEYIERKTILPDYIVEKYTKKDFWKNDINYE